MIPDWTHHLKDKEEKDRFVKYLLSSKGVLDRLLEIMERDEDEITSQEITTKSYENPSWAALQADRNGYRRCLHKYRKLLNLDKGTDNG